MMLLASIGVVLLIGLNVLGLVLAAQAPDHPTTRKVMLAQSAIFLLLTWFAISRHSGVSFMNGGIQ